MTDRIAINGQGDFLNLLNSDLDKLDMEQDEMLTHIIKAYFSKFRERSTTGNGNIDVADLLEVRNSLFASLNDITALINEDYEQRAKTKY